MVVIGSSLNLTMDARIGGLMRLENVDCCDRQCGFDSYSIRHWNVGREANCTGLLNRHPVIGIEGSNPSRSAMLL